jgi:prepilin-type N-terminal cleavage/methylation domain-containing protein
MKSRGFTLIELMIVVAIIAIIAAIAIPNLLESRLVTNETAGGSGCKAYAAAQDIYRRTDWDHDGVKEYAQAIGNLAPGGVALFCGNSLFSNEAQGDIGLVDFAFAAAEGVSAIEAVAFPFPATPKAGYCYFVQMGQNNPQLGAGFERFYGALRAGGAATLPAEADAAALNGPRVDGYQWLTEWDMGLGYGVSAIPMTYNRTGRNSFQINNAGATCMRDRRANADGGIEAHIGLANAWTLLDTRGVAVTYDPKYTAPGDPQSLDIDNGPWATIE